MKGSNKRAYSRLYVADIMDNQGESFAMLRERCPGIDVKWYIESYMRSIIREQLDEGNFWWANNTPGQLIDRYIRGYVSDRMDNRDYKHGKDWGGLNLYWIGRIYAYYQWYYNVKSKWLIEALPLDTMDQIFGTLHQCGDLTAIRKIHDEVL
jgi:hypothetical protein